MCFHFSPFARRNERNYTEYCSTNKEEQSNTIKLFAVALLAMKNMKISCVKKYNDILNSHLNNVMPTHDWSEAILCQWNITCDWSEQSNLWHPYHRVKLRPIDFHPNRSTDFGSDQRAERRKNMSKWKWTMYSHKFQWKKRSEKHFYDTKFTSSNDRNATEKQKVNRHFHATLMYFRENSEPTKNYSQVTPND